MVVDFNNCKAQVEVLFHDLHLSSLDVMKEVKDDEIVTFSDFEGKDEVKDDEAKDNTWGN